MSASIGNVSPTLYLRVEGGALLAISLLGYARFVHEPSWLVFAAAFLLPDIAMLGYLVNRGVGALAYNLAHSEVLPAALLVATLFGAPSWLLSVALIWLAHIGFDRLLGYGLKHGDAFTHTHLGRIGRAHPPA